MKQVDLNDTKQMNSTSRLICEEVLARGWKVEVPYVMSPHLFITLKEGKRIHVFSSTPQTVSFASAHLANDKYATSVVLSSSGIPQLEMAMLLDNDTNYQPAIDMITRHKNVVVKPTDGAHGNGITVNVSTPEGFAHALAHALEFSKSRSVLVQQQFEGSTRDIRMLCIGRKFIAATERVPAHVIGDGTHTISELIDIENASPDRGVAYHEKLATIDIERAKQYLGETINTIPEIDAHVTVLGIANYGAGGETVDITDTIPVWMQEQAEKASDALGLDVSGIDYIVTSSVPLEKLKNVTDQAVIIEVNKCPALVIHDEPTHGLNRNTTKTYVDFISQLQQ